MQGEKLIISNGQFFKFHPVPYWWKSISELSLSISSKFRFYLYFDYVIEVFLIHVNMNKNVFKFVGSYFIIEFKCKKYSTSSKLQKILSGVTYNKQLVDENGQLLYPSNCNMPSSSHNPRLMMVIIVWYNVTWTN